MRARARARAPSTRRSSHPNRPASGKLARIRSAVNMRRGRRSSGTDAAGGAASVTPLGEHAHLSHRDERHLHGPLGHLRERELRPHRPRHHDHAASENGCHAPHGLRQQQLLGADDRDGPTRHPPVSRVLRAPFEGGRVIRVVPYDRFMSDLTEVADVEPVGERRVNTFALVALLSAAVALFWNPFGLPAVVAVICGGVGFVHGRVIGVGRAASVVAVVLGVIGIIAAAVYYG